MVKDPSIFITGGGGGGEGGREGVGLGGRILDLLP